MTEFKSWHMIEDEPYMEKRCFYNFSQLLNLFLAASYIRVRHIWLLFNLQLKIILLKGCQLHQGYWVNIKLGQWWRQLSRGSRTKTTLHGGRRGWILGIWDNTIQVTLLFNKTTIYTSQLWPVWIRVANYTLYLNSTMQILRWMPAWIIFFHTIHIFKPH